MQDDGADPGPDSERAAAVADGVEPEPDPERRLETRPGSGSLSRADVQRDSTVRQWGVVTPSATVIGRADSPTRTSPRAFVASTTNSTRRRRATANALTTSIGCGRRRRCATPST